MNEIQKGDIKSGLFVGLLFAVMSFFFISIRDKEAFDLGVVLWGAGLGLMFSALYIYGTDWFELTTLLTAIFLFSLFVGLVDLKMGLISIGLFVCGTLFGRAVNLVFKKYQSLINSFRAN